jgi:hypothetical protein
VPCQSLALQDIASAGDVTIHIITSDVDHSIILRPTSTSSVISAVDASAPQTCLYCLEAGQTSFASSCSSEIADGLTDQCACPRSADVGPCENFYEPKARSGGARDSAVDSGAAEQASTSATTERLVLSVANMQDKQHQQLTGLRWLLPPSLQLISSGSPIDV